MSRRRGVSSASARVSVAYLDRAAAARSGPGSSSGRSIAALRIGQGDEPLVAAPVRQRRMKSHLQQILLGTAHLADRDCTLDPKPGVVQHVACELRRTQTPGQPRPQLVIAMRKEGVAASRG